MLVRRLNIFITFLLHCEKRLTMIGRVAYDLTVTTKSFSCAMILTLNDSDIIVMLPLHTYYKKAAQ